MKDSASQGLSETGRRPFPAIATVVTAALLISSGLVETPPSLAETQETVATILFPSDIGNVEFQHLMHASDFEIACPECHHETDARELETPHPGYIETSSVDCAGCHHQRAEASASLSCTHCHPDTPAHIADETLSSKVVIHEVCWRCHEVGRGRHASRACPTCHQVSTVADS